MRSPDVFALSRAVTFFKYSLPYSKFWGPGVETLPDIEHLSLLNSKLFCASSLRKLEWEKRRKRRKAEWKPNNHSRNQRSQILIWIEAKISDFSLLLLHERPLNFLSFKIQRWLLTLTDRCLELGMHLTLYSPKDYLKAFWKRNTKIILMAVINSWPRSGKGSKGLL